MSIKSIREDRGLSLCTVAKKAGITKSYLSDLENNKNNNPTIRTIMLLSKAFDVELIVIANQFLCD